MPVKINSSGGGSVTLSSGSIATDVTATFPATTGNAVVDTAVQTLTNKTLTSPTIGGTPVMNASVLTLGTAQASTSGTSIDFTGIPSWVRRVTVMLSGVSTNGTNIVQIQLGTVSGIETTGYNAGAVIQASATLFTGNVTTGFPVGAAGNSAATAVRFGSYVFSTLGGNVWTGQGNIHETTFYGLGAQCAGGKTLAGVLDRVRITTVGGTDLFDAGTINIMWE
jgi:hypothetical protein